MAGIVNQPALVDIPRPQRRARLVDAELAAIAGLVSAADRLPYFTGLGTAALATFTGAGRALVDDADAGAQRTTLGLGTAALLNLAQADQAALEAETNEDTYVPPDLVKHSPGVAKVWVKWEQAGAHSLLNSYNMTSVTDGSATGDTDHLWNVDFSSAEYVLAGAGTDNNRIAVQTATFLGAGVTTITRVADTAAAADDNHSMLAGFGDQ